MKQLLVAMAVMSMQTPLWAAENQDEQAVRQAALDYIESQHEVAPERMEKALHKQLAKRTYWQKGDGGEFVMETSYDTMVRVAASYNKKGDRFPASPKKTVKVLDVGGRVASVKLIADDWIDYMHLMKNDQGQWQIVNVLWQYHDQSKHSSQ